MEKREGTRMLLLVVSQNLLFLPASSDDDAELR